MLMTLYLSLMELASKSLHETIHVLDKFSLFFSGLTVNFDKSHAVWIRLNKFSQKKIQKIRSLIKLWKRRYSTPLGKITVFRSILKPLLNHLFISIQSPSEKLMKDVFFECLWERSVKVKCNVVVKNIVKEV